MPFIIFTRGEKVPNLVSVFDPIAFDARTSGLKTKQYIGKPKYIREPL